MDGRKNDRQMQPMIRQNTNDPKMMPKMAPTVMAPEEPYAWHA
jgi:hypothetical protein